MISCNGTVVGGRLPRVCNGRMDRQEPNRQEEFVGDRCDENETDCFRIVTQNINGIGREVGNIKETSVKAFIQDFSIDVLAVQQLDVCWDRVGNKKKIWDRFRGWQERVVIFQWFLIQRTVIGWLTSLEEQRWYQRVRLLTHGIHLV